LRRLSCNLTNGFNWTPSFTQVGAGDYAISTSLYNLGSHGLAPPTLLGLGSNTFSNPDIINPTYAGFSVLADGGIAKVDNLVVGQKVWVAPFADAAE
jgi:hypothetical protein